MKDPTETPRILKNILEAIGNTPLVKLNRVIGEKDVNILVKCEYLNPSGSIKDRMALCMIDSAEKSNQIKPGISTITDASSGNTAQALALVGAVKGYKVKIRYPGVTAVPEKIKPLERYGAEIDVVKVDSVEAEKIAKDAGLHGATIEIPGRYKCLREEKNIPDHLWVRQFSNPANVAGQSEIGRELLEQTGGKIDVFIASIGTGGTFLGVSQVLKTELPNVKCIAVQPATPDGWEDPLAPDQKYIPELSGGIGKEIRDCGIADEIVHVSNEDARNIAYQLSSKEGIYCGMSSGANVFIALREAQRPEMRAKNIVTLIVDRGDRHLVDERYVT